MSKVKTVLRYNQNYKSFSFSNMEPEADEEYLESRIELDDEGRILKESKCLEDGELEEENSFTYDKNGKILTHVLFFAAEDVTEKRVFERNEKGDLLSETTLYGDEEGEKTVYRYDEKGNIVGIEQFDEEGSANSSEEVLYNQDGKIIERKMFDADKKPAGRTTFTYNGDREIEETEYDANWLS